ncbi:MAG: leucine-rich repeat domain-containing protein, partial [Treponema sp.]|nr:leucine-rich repeat domain-containing protein [Treponema sp.]
SALDDNTAGTALSGETAAAYTPPTDTTGTVYYYVIVTNTRGSRKAAASSNTAAIQVNDKINAQVPNITGQPVGNTYPCNTSPAALSVTVDPVTDGVLSYQWYSNTNNSNSGGSEISGETTDSFTPLTAATAGTFYYYVQVTNTITDNGDGGAKAQSRNSDVAAIIFTVTDAETPVITGQPQGGVYRQNTASVPLTVTASGDGDLSYQWYSDTDGDMNNGNTAVGTDSSSYTPPTTVAGTFYYYVKVTNTITTNPGDGGDKVKFVYSGPAEVTVTAVFTDLAGIASYLAGASGGSDTDPVPLSVNMELSAANWTGILAAIDSKGKYVALDLSACTKGSHLSGSGLYSDETFDPYKSSATGEGKIVSLTLPDAATSIAASGSSTFRYFTSLTSVSGKNVTHIGVSAFSDCTVLETVNITKAVTISSLAFWGCSALTAISLPVVQSIGNYAFGSSGLVSVEIPASLSSLGRAPFFRCTSLSSFTVNGNPQFSTGGGGTMLMNGDGTVLLSWPTASGNVSLPSVTGISERAFSNNTLITISLPSAKTIGTEAFAYCTALTAVELPAAESIGDLAFVYCTALTTLKLPALPPPNLGVMLFAYTLDASAPTILSIKVPSVGAYVGIIENTSANWNWSKYGLNHKEIEIIAAP